MDWRSLTINASAAEARTLLPCIRPDRGVIGALQPLPDAAPDVRIYMAA
jgi:hypothetical protein